MEDDRANGTLRYREVQLSSGTLEAPVRPPTPRTPPAPRTPRTPPSPPSTPRVLRPSRTPPRARRLRSPLFALRFPSNRTWGDRLQQPQLPLSHMGYPGRLQRQQTYLAPSDRDPGWAMCAFLPRERTWLPGSTRMAEARRPSPACDGGEGGVVKAQAHREAAWGGWPTMVDTMDTRPPQSPSASQGPPRAAWGIGPRVARWRAGCVIARPLGRGGWLACTMHSAPSKRAASCWPGVGKLLPHGPHHWHSSTQKRPSVGCCTYVEQLRLHFRPEMQPQLE